MIDSHYCYHNGAMAEREEQTAGDWKLSETDESSGCIVDGTAQSLTFKEKIGATTSAIRYQTKGKHQK